MGLTSRMKGTDEKIFFIEEDGQRKGPFSIDEIEPMIQAEQIIPQTKVWKNGMSDWRRADSVPEIRNMFKSLPPPISGDKK
jgi:hypothetical protein